MRIRRVLGNWLAALAILSLTACGGGGADTIINDGGGDDGGDTGGDDGGTTVVVADIVLLASSPQLLSSADQTDEGVTITAQVIDDNGVVITTEDVQFMVPVGSAVLTTVTDTDADQAILTTGGDATNRVVTVSATAGDVTETIDIPVTGTTLVLNGPEQAGSGQTVEYTATLEDGSGDGLSGESITFETATGSIDSADTATDTSGSASATVTPTADGDISVSALGLTATLTLAVTEDEFVIVEPSADTEIPLNTAQAFTARWLRSGSSDETAGMSVVMSSTRGTVSPATATLDANGEVAFTVTSTNAGGAVVAVSSADDPAVVAQSSVEFVATTPEVVDVQASPATVSLNESSTISAIVRDGAGNLVKNQQVNFSLDDVTGGSLSAPSAVTNSQGTASVTYTASNTTSANGGVVITASLASGTITDTATLTVGGGALFVSLGTGNTLFEPNETTYAMPYNLTVTDSAGNAVPNATHRISVIPVGYYKGTWRVRGTPAAWVQQVVANCDNEDVDYDGVLDDGEDFNNSGRLEPGNVVSVPDSVELDDTGSGQFNLTYAQDHAYWARVILRAVATVEGTETVAEAEFDLPGIASDYDDADIGVPGQVSPYGTGPCTSPN